MYGKTQSLKFKMTNSSCVMKGRFLTFPYVEETPGVFWNRQHTVGIEEYYPTGFVNFKDIKHVCVAGQSLNPKDPEWIEITWCASCKTKWDRGNCPRCAGTTVSPYGTPHHT